MSSALDQTERAKRIVTSFYDGGARGQITDFAEQLSEDFELFVPDYLPWGGRFDKAGYVALLPGVTEALDSGRLNYLSFTGECGHVVALIEIGIQGTDATTIISEHWDLAGDKAVRLRVAYYDPTLLLAQVGAAPTKVAA